MRELPPFERGRAAHIEQFNAIFIRLCATYSREEAYRMAEKLHKHRNGDRLYKNYDSFRNSRSYHLNKKRNKHGR
jgi:hypothetical protein